MFIFNVAYFRYKVYGKSHINLNTFVTIFIYKKIPGRTLILLDIVVSPAHSFTNEFGARVSTQR